MPCSWPFDFQTGDVFSGPVGTGDQLHICGAPQFNGGSLNVPSLASNAPSTSYAYEIEGSTQVEPSNQTTNGGPYPTTDPENEPAEYAKCTYDGTGAVTDTASAAVTSPPPSVWPDCIIENPVVDAAAVRPDRVVRCPGLRRRLRTREQRQAAGADPQRLGHQRLPGPLRPHQRVRLREGLQASTPGSATPSRPTSAASTRAGPS